MMSLETTPAYAAPMTDAATDNLSMLDEAALAARIASAAPSHDEPAECELCRRLAPRIRLYGRKHLRHEAEAHDLMQDVLIMVLAKLRQAEVRDPAQIASFALGTARQRVLDIRRGERRRAALLAEFPLDLPQDVAEAEEPQDTPCLARCLAALPERERAVIVMTFYDDRPAEELARELRLTPVNVRVIRHRALERLRKCVEAGGKLA
jgi:RNA polymerase sigma-70 factor (ECF subfamily)